jgi:hypothetical protein
MNERSLAALASSPAGCEWLAERGVYTEQEGFNTALRVPALAGAAELIGLQPDRQIVYVGQQVAADFARATVAKFVAAQALVDTGESDYAVIWHDMDRGDSDRFMMRIVLQLGSATMSAWLADRKLGYRETRFIPADHARLDDVFQKARSTAVGVPKATRPKVLERIDILRAALEADRPATTADAARIIGARLLGEQVGVDLPWTYVSSLVSARLLNDVLLEVLAAHSEVVRTFNEAVEAVHAAGLDPQVHELDRSWLPLWWNCPDSGRRLRLTRETAGVDVYARAAECACGRLHRFHLGGARPTLDELEAAGRWSPDVLLPVLVDRRFSGYVAGKSSALYGIVMRTVLQDALGHQPTPCFLPTELTSGAVAPTAPDSILHAYLFG